MNLSNFMTSLIRTAVPIAVGALLAWAVRQGIPATDSLRDPLTEALTLVLSAGYYAGVRALEAKWPQLGVLLGVPAKPEYPVQVKKVP